MTVVGWVAKRVEATPGACACGGHVVVGIPEPLCQSCAEDFYQTLVKVGASATRLDPDTTLAQALAPKVKREDMACGWFKCRNRLGPDPKAATRRGGDRRRYCGRRCQMSANQSRYAWGNVPVREKRYFG